MSHVAHRPPSPRPRRCPSRQPSQQPSKQPSPAVRPVPHPPAPPLRPERRPEAHALCALLTGPDERARHPAALARELAPGLHELVALRGEGGTQIPRGEELAPLGLGTAALFRRARLGARAAELAFSVAAPGPGVQAYMLGGPGLVDAAAAVFELDDLLGQPLGPAGVVVAVPCRATALFVVPGATRLRRALVPYGLRPFWCAEQESAPQRPGASLRFLAAWAQSAHRSLPGPVSPALYWHAHGRVHVLSARGELSLGTLPRELARLVVERG